MNTRIRFLLTFLFLMTLPASSLFFLPTGTKDPITDFPEKVGERVELKTGGTRFVTYYPDGTRQYAIEYLEDGTISQFWYRSDGTLSEAITRLKENDGSYKLLRHATLAEDGKTYRQDKQFFRSGTIAKLSIMIDQETIWRRTFHENGVLCKDARLEKRDGKWLLVSRQVRRQDGSLEERFKHLGGFGSTRTERFDTRGNLTATLVLEKTRYSAIYKETWYFPGSKVPNRLVEQSSSKTTIKVKRLNGSLSKRIEVNGDLTSSHVSIWCHFFSEAGKKTMEQWWALKNGEQLLDFVKFYRKDESVARYVWFSRQTKAVTSDVIFHGSENSGPRTIRRYREEDGTLKEVEEVGNGNKTLSEEEYSSEDKIIAAVDPAWTVPISVPLPPQVIEYVADRGP